MKLNAAKFERSPGKIFHIRQESSLTPLDYKGIKLKLDSPIQLTGQAFFKDDTVYLDASVKATVRRRCSRCLKELLVEVTRRDDFEFKRGENEGERLSSQRFIYGYQGEEIELLPLFSNLIASSLDPKPLCKPDCAGICPRCGVDLNEEDCKCVERKHVDPRLAKLKELL